MRRYCFVAQARTLISGSLNSRFVAKVNADVGELYLYDAIGGDMFGGIAPIDVANALAGMKSAKSLSVYINSPGGSVFDGVAIYNLLKRFDGPVNVFVDGLAASIASVIAMAGTTIATAYNARWMVHEPMAVGMGNAADMRDVAEKLEGIRGMLLDTYTKRTGQTAERVSQWMADETWMDARTAQANGFTDTVIDENGEPQARVADPAFPLLTKYAKTPSDLLARASATDVKLATMDYRILRNARRASLADK